MDLLRLLHYQDQLSPDQHSSLFRVGRLPYFYPLNHTHTHRLNHGLLRHTTPLYDSSTGHFNAECFFTFKFQIIVKIALAPHFIT